MWLVEFKKGYVTLSNLRVEGHSSGPSLEAKGLLVPPWKARGFYLLSGCHGSSEPSLDVWRHRRCY